LSTSAGTELEAREVLLVVLAVIGLLFVAVALRVVRREGQFFVEARSLARNPLGNIDLPGRPPD